MRRGSELAARKELQGFTRLEGETVGGDGYLDGFGALAPRADPETGFRVRGGHDLGFGLGVVEVHGGA